MNAPLDGHLFGPGQPCFGCAPDHPMGFRLAFEPEPDGVRTTFVPADTYQGPPGIMHGGLVMTLIDEIAAWAIINSLRKFGFTSKVEVDLKGPVRIGVPVEGRGRIVKNLRRLVYTEVELHQAEKLVAQAKLRFVLLDEAATEKLLEAPLPPAWKAFAR